MKEKYKDNCFDYIRMISAVIILVGHASDHLDIELGIVGVVTGWWRGLICLFVISGFLIPASLERSESRKEYIEKRFLRLYPGLWVAFLVSFIMVLYVGRIYGLTFKLFDVITWIIAQVTFFQFYTPPSMKSYGVGNPNGALWTISIEVQVYLAIMLFWNRLKRLSLVKWLGLICSTIGINILFGELYKNNHGTLAKLVNVSVIPYTYLFLIGMFLYAKKDTILPWLIKNFGVFFALMLGWYFLNRYFIHLTYGHYIDVISGVLLSICTISGGYAVGKHELKYEVSYGLYIYHMIIINVLAMMGCKSNILLVPLILVVSYLFARLSSRYIEHPVMELFKKNRRLD